jgi:ABC-type nitrate/sulfonate/bicarbonate transport system substrate-binding protein
VPRPRLSLLALAAATSALVGCGRGTRESTVSPRPAIAVGSAFANDAGAVADRIVFARLRRGEGISVRVRDLGGVANAVVALVRGDVQLAAMPYSTAIRATEEGAHIRVVLGRTMASDDMLVARPGIESVEELRGRRVTFDERGLDGETLVRDALDRAGVPNPDVKLSALADPSSRVAALAAGRTDAAVLDELGYEQLLGRGLAVNVLARLSDVRPRSTETVWVVSQSYEKTHRALLGRVVRGLLDGYAFVYTHAGRRAWIAAARRFVLRDVPELAPRIYAFDKSARTWPLRDSPVTPAQHRRTVRFWLDLHQLEEYVPFSRVWDASFWRNAAVSRY